MISLLLSSLFFSQAQFSISPLSIEQVLVSGAKKQFEIIVYNESKTQPASLRIYPTDIIQTAAGNYEITEIGKGVLSCAAWIKIKDSIVVLEPDSAKTITCLIQVPHNAKGGGYGAIVVENKLSPNESSFKIRMPIILKITIKPYTRPKALITDIKVEDAKISQKTRQNNILKDAIAISASVKNESDIHIITKGKLILRNKEGMRIREVPLGEANGVILPGSTVDIKSIINKPPVGEYIADVSVNYGVRSPAKARKPFEILKEMVAGKRGFSSSTPLAITLMPEFIDINILPNAFRSQSIILYNEESTSVKVNAEIKELTSDETGELLTSENSDTSLWSCSKWIQFEPKEFIIKPNERKPINIKIQVPNSNGSGDRYAQIVFNISKDTFMPTTYPMPVFLSYQRNVNPDLKIDDVKVISASSNVFGVYIQNIGDVRLKPTGKITIERKKTIPGAFGENNVIIGEFPLNTIKDYVLPDRFAILQADGPKELEQGKYNIKVEIDYYKDKYTLFEKEINI